MLAKLKSKAFWAAVAGATAAFLAGNATPIDIVRTVIEAFVAK